MYEEYDRDNGFAAAAGRIVGGMTGINEPVIITQRGRPAAVLLSVTRYSEIEQDLERLDQLELVEMVERARQEIAKGNTISHRRVKARLSERDSQGKRRVR